MALSSKQQIWLDAYLQTWNATEAARRAGYAHPRQEGARLLSNAVMQEEIKSRLAEMTMTADEVLVRLGEQARADYADYINEVGSVDLAGMKRDDKMHLVKGVKPSKYGLVVEFYDAHSALVQIGKHHKLFTDGVDISGELELKQNESALEQVVGRMSLIAERIRAAAAPTGDSANGDGAESA